MLVSAGNGDWRGINSDSEPFSSRQASLMSRSWARAAAVESRASLVLLG